MSITSPSTCPPQWPVAACGARHQFLDFRGETLCIVGESGCGKSMTSLALMNLLPRGASARPPAAFDGQTCPPARPGDE
jgi:ABC-type uncharacterized transport system fused permease/ATPase subunit